MQLLIYHANQCNPKKCTGKKLARFDMVRLTNHINQLLPYLVLSPFSQKALSPEDKGTKGLAALDCSWAHAEEVFMRFKLMGEGTAIPGGGQSRELWKTLQALHGRGAGRRADYIG